jgi:hypothetical protein
MEFTNAYDLVLYLFKQGQLEGICYTGFYGEVILESNIEDESLIKLLKSIWYEWSGISDGSTAKEVGDYSLHYSEKEGLSLVGYCEDEYPSNKNDIQVDEILQAIIQYLDLTKIDHDIPLNEQIDLIFEMDIDELPEKFEIESPNSDELDEEIQDKLKNFDIEALSNFVGQHVIAIHQKLNPDKEFKIYIESSHIYTYSIFWEEKFINLKDSLGNIKVEYSITHSED